MNSEYFTFSATEVGYNHVKNCKVCEDAAGFYDDDTMHICVVADGHGSDNYPRTERGSRIAVDSAIKCVTDFIKLVDTQDVLLDEKRGFPVLLQLTKSILMDWHESVQKDYQSAPFSEGELKCVSEKYRNMYLSENDDEKHVEKAYGCTLILFAITTEYSFGLQIGDGKCIAVSDEGDFIEPIPWDENCQFNITTSICDSDAIDEFRFFVTDKAPAAVFCGSDGIDDCYSNSDELYALYRSILRIFIEHGTEIGKNEIEEYLPVLTRKGSGDDVSIGLVINTEKIKQLSRVFEFQAELFNLNEELKNEKQMLSSNKEKDKSLAARIIKILGSGEKVSDQNVEEVQKVKGLRTSRSVIEGEITAIEKRIRELEESLRNSSFLFVETSSEITEETTPDIPSENDVILEDDNKSVVTLGDGTAECQDLDNTPVDMEKTTDIDEPVDDSIKPLLSDPELTENQESLLKAADQEDA